MNDIYFVESIVDLIGEDTISIILYNEVDDDFITIEVDRKQPFNFIEGDFVRYKDNKISVIN